MRLADKLATFSLEVTRSDLEAFLGIWGPVKKRLANTYIFDRLRKLATVGGRPTHLQTYICTYTHTYRNL